MDFEKEYRFDPNYLYYLQLPNNQRKRLDLEDLYRLMRNQKNSLPDVIGQKTWVSNYILTFWMPIMKPGPFAVYMQIAKMAYGDKTYAFPSVPYLSMLLGVGERTVREYINRLVELGFLVVVERFDANTNSQLTNLYFLSSTIPILPKTYYEQLPPRLQQEHDRFMNMIEFRYVFEEKQGV